MDVDNASTFKDAREKSIRDIIAITKLASLFFCVIIIFNSSSMQNKINGKAGYLSITTLGLTCFIMILVYCLWLFFSMKILVTKYIKFAQVIENFIFTGMFAVLIILSDTYMSQYKFLFIFVIITSTIQLGMKYGMTMALICSIMVLGIDLIYGHRSGINLYFENDLILVGVFILTAWPLGYYVKIENANLKQKNLQLLQLNNELNEQGKQRKYIEEMLLKNETCYNLLIENSRDAIFVHRDTNLIFANESAAKLVGFMEQMDLKGKSILDFIPIDQKDAIRDRFAKIYDKKTDILSFEGKILKSNGDTIDVENTSTYFVYEGKRTILSIVRDITSEKQVEKLQKDVKKNIELLNESREVNKLITEFFSNISHELKTPLNVIFSAIQLLSIYNKKGEDNVEKNSKYLKVMKQNCYRLTKLINNLLDMTRLDSGFLKLHMQNCNIISVVEEITLSVASYVESKGISLIFDTNVEEKIVAFDPDKIERIILNLLSNAVKFTNAGGEIYVSVMDNEDNIIISVKDTGVGIPDDKQEMIFKRFGQVDKTFRRNREGSGIGLSLVKSFVEMHGGIIDVKSEIGKGSEFIIKLPVKVLEQEYIEENSIYESDIERINIEFSDIYSDSMSV